MKLSTKIILPIILISALLILLAGCFGVPADESPEFTPGTISGIIAAPCCPTTSADTVSNPPENWCCLGTDIGCKETWSLQDGVEVILTYGLDEVARVFTDEDGEYTFTNVPTAKNYVITALCPDYDERPLVKDVALEVVEGEVFDAKITDLVSTSLGLVVDYLVNNTTVLGPENIELDEVIADKCAFIHFPAFRTLVRYVRRVGEDCGNLNTDEDVQVALCKAAQEVGRIVIPDLDLGCSPGYTSLIPPTVRYTLITAAVPPEGGTVSGAGTYNSGTTVNVEATPNEGYEFDHWSGALSGSDNPTTILMNSNKSVTANFEEIIDPNPALSVTKTATVSTYDEVGDVITYVIEVENTGNVTLTNIVVSDPQATISGSPIDSLAPGATDSSVTATYTITQADLDAGSFTNTATANSNEGATGDDDETVDAVQDAALSVTKTADPYPQTYSSVGDVITYTIVVENTGNVTLTNIVVEDLVAGVAVTGSPIASLVPGATATVTATYSIVQADLNFGSFTNTATATSDEGATDDDDETVDAVCVSTDLSFFSLEIQEGSSWNEYLGDVYPFDPSTTVYGVMAKKNASHFRFTVDAECEGEASLYYNWYRGISCTDDWLTGESGYLEPPTNWIPITSGGTYPTDTNDRPVCNKGGNVLFIKVTNVGSSDKIYKVNVDRPNP